MKLKGEIGVLGKGWRKTEEKKEEEKRRQRKRKESGEKGGEIEKVRRKRRWTQKAESYYLSVTT